MSGEKLTQQHGVDKAVWGRCDNREVDIPHLETAHCTNFRPEVEAAQGPMAIHHFEPEPDCIRHTTYEEVRGAVYTLWGKDFKDAPGLLRYIRDLQERKRQLEEANDELRVRCDSAYRRGREEAAREFRRKVAELMLCGERD